MSNDEIVPGFDDELDDSLAIHLEKVSDLEGCLLLQLSGIIYRDPTNIFVRRVTRAIENGFIRLIFDLSGLAWVSSGVYVFTSFLKAIKPRGGDLVFINVRPKVLEVFELLGFSQFFNFSASLTEAISFFSSGIAVFSVEPAATPSSNDAIVPGFDGEMDDSLEIRLERVDALEHGLLLALRGYLDDYNDDRFSTSVARAINAGFTRLVFELHDLSYISANGIQKIINFLKKTKPGGGDIVLVNVPPKVMELLDVLGLKGYLNFRKSVAGAIECFASSDAAPQFPFAVRCPGCDRRVWTRKAGLFRCRTCATVLVIEPSGRFRLSSGHPA